MCSLKHLLKTMRLTCLIFILVGAFFEATYHPAYGQLYKNFSSHTTTNGATSGGFEPEIGLKSSEITNQTPHQDTLNQSCISRKGLASYPRSSVLKSFKTTGLQHCWRYCKVMGLCEVFVFHFITRDCSLYKNKMLKYQLESGPDIAVGMLDCLECIGEVREVIEKSKSGVLIKMLQRCLSVERSENGTNYNYRLSWKDCKGADLWKLSKIENDSGASNERVFYRISKMNSNLELNWMIKDGRLGMIFPDIKSNISIRSIHVDKSTTVFRSVCRFKIQAFLDDKVHPVHLNTLDGEFPSWPLASVSFIAPFSQERCPLRQFSIKHGVFVNSDKVPYFLPGTLVPIQCKSGYGFKALNFTPFQRVICHKGARPLPCSVIKCGMDSNERELELLCLILVLVLSFTTIAFATGLIFFKCRIRFRDLNMEVVVEDAAHN